MASSAANLENNPIEINNNHNDIQKYPNKNKKQEDLKDSVSVNRSSRPINLKKKKSKKHSKS